MQVRRLRIFHTYHARSVPNRTALLVRKTPTARWVSYAISLVVLHVDLDPQ